MGCQFKGEEEYFTNASGIYAHDTFVASPDDDCPEILSVIDCLFDNVGGYDADPSISINGSIKTAALTIIGNTFKNLNAAPIGSQNNWMRVKVNDGAILKYNKIDSNVSDILYAFLD